MRFIHTSDWHIGRTLEQNSLAEAHELFFDHLIEQVDEYKVEAVLVAGDVYDRAVPSSESVALFDRILSELASRTNVVITSGNHDSSQRLGFASKILERGNVYLRTRTEDLLNPVILGRESEQVAIYGIPYLEPALTIHKLRNMANLESEEPPSQESVLRLATDLIRKHAQTNKFKNTVIVSHAWFAGGDPSESERPLALGGLGIVPLTVLDGFTYSALGHIHKPGKPSENIRYSGSPIKFSFSEVNHVKLTLLVDLKDGEAKVTEIKAPVWRDMADIEGTLEELLTDGRFTKFENHWVRASLLATEIPQFAMEKLRVRFPNIVKLKLPMVNTDNLPTIDVNEISAEELCCTFLDTVRGETKQVSQWEIEQIRSAVNTVESGLFQNENSKIKLGSAS